MREKRTRARRVGSVVGAAAILAASWGDAAADDAGAPDGGGCPAEERIWSSATSLVPAAAAELLAARPRVEIVDLGERYRVRVRTPGGVVERTYVDPARNCEKRARFAAEFVVITLLPPQLAMPGLEAPENGDAGGAPPTTGPAGQAQASPAEAPLAKAPVTPPAEEHRIAPAESPAAGDAGVRRRPSIARVELGAVGLVSPPALGAPTILSAGVDLRGRVGRGRLAAVACAAFVPAESFGAPGFRGTLLRIPATAGVRLRWTRAALEIAGDLALGAAFERYAGQSPHDPAASTRVTPEASAAVTGSLAVTSGFGAFLRLQLDGEPWQQDLAALPNPTVTKTPAMWLSAAVGISFER